MKLKIKIELFEEHEKVNFYTLRFLNEETEVDKFFDQFPEGCEYDEDIAIIIKWLDKIGKMGALERNFRPEGKWRDNVWAIPIETASLRLYVLRLSENIVLLGNGGIKTTATYNENEILKKHVELLQDVDRCIKERSKSGKLHFNQKQLLGDLYFRLKGTYDEK